MNRDDIIRMTDRELLELSAKAAGMDVIADSQGIFWMRLKPYQKINYMWNPLEDDGDALRLAVKLGISLLPYPVYEEKERHSVIAKQRRRDDLLRQANPTEVQELYGIDSCAATRLAIVRAAAEIGRVM